MGQEQELKRKISLENDFMSYKHGSDILYGFMYNKATYDPETQQLYLTKYRYNKLKPYIKVLFSDKGRTFMTDNLDKLIKAELIQEGFVSTKTNPKTPCYFFPNKEYNKYKLINNDILMYVVYTRNSCAVRIYTYLYNKYEWKKESGEDYEFTIKELRIALGWAPTSRTCNEIIELNLESLAREGIIRYIDSYATDEDGITRPIKYLNFVAAKKSDLIQLNQGIEASINLVSRI